MYSIPSYNPYAPAYMNTMSGYQPQIQPSVQPQPAPQPQGEQQKTNCQWIPVNGISQVQDHIVQPNQQLYFLDNNNPIFYVKSADGFGTAKTEAYRFEKINDEPEIKTSEIDEIKKRLDRIENAMRGEQNNESINSQHERK